MDKQFNKMKKLLDEKLMDIELEEKKLAKKK